RRLVCFWLHPVPQNKGGLAASNDGDYEKTQAAADFKKAESFFNIDVQPLKTNALNLYDDVHNAFIVKLFKDSDKPCFHVLSESSTSPISISSSRKYILARHKPWSKIQRSRR